MKNFPENFQRKIQWQLSSCFSKIYKNPCWVIMTLTIQIKEIEIWSQSFSFLSKTHVYHIFSLWDNSVHSPWYNLFFFFFLMKIISHSRVRECILANRLFSFIQKNAEKYLLIIYVNSIKLINKLKLMA